MRSYEVFARLDPARAVEVMRAISKQSPSVFRQMVDTAALASRSRPVYMRRQPLEKRAEAVRRTLSRVAANDAAEELLAIYFLECRKPLLLEWLDCVGIEHEDGMLESDPPQPDAKTMQNAVERFRSKDEDADRTLLLRAFAAQTAVDWPDLDALVSE